MSKFPCRWYNKSWMYIEKTIYILTILSLHLFLCLQNGDTLHWNWKSWNCCSLQSKTTLFGHRESSTYKLWQSSWVVTSCLPYAVAEKLLGISRGPNPGPGYTFAMRRNCRKCNILLVLYYVCTFCCTCIYYDVT